MIPAAGLLSIAWLIGTFALLIGIVMIALAFRPSASRPEHRALRDAALRHDAAEASVLLRHHIQAGVQHALSRMETFPG